MLHIISLILILSMTPSFADPKPPPYINPHSRFPDGPPGLKHHNTHGVPAPLMAAGLPTLLVAGYGVYYWLRRRKDDREMWY